MLWLYYLWLYMKVHILIAYGELHDLLAWKILASWLNSWEWILWIYCIICKIKRFFILTYVIWEVNTKSFWQEMSWGLWEPCEYLGHSNILWNYLEVNCVFWIKGNFWVLYVLPMCCDMWLPSDYLARYYSLCNIGILALIFFMVIEFRLCDGIFSSDCMSAMSSVFVTALLCGLGFGIVLLLLTNYSM